ncbi:MAG: purine phosphorylase [Verrucomicrobia bacterium]|jgi:adenosylhomocysteine nucleosidase|nr:purine phosphorylase [Verrucomicrobiota bacterium]
MKLLSHYSSVAVCLVLLAGCASTGMEKAYGPRDFDSPGYTALVVAYAPEMEGMLATIDQRPDASITETVNFKGVTYRIGEFQGEPILVFATGMSIANAAMTMQMAFDYFPVKEVVYMGIAGAVNPKWQPGDVVVPERWYYHDESVYSNPDPENPGQFILPDYYAEFLAEQPARRAADPHIPEYKPFAFVHPDEVVVIKAGMDAPEDAAYFSATPRLLEAARQAAEALPPQMVGEREVAIRVGGNGVTGSVFLDNREYRKWTREVFAAEVTEMESAAIGQVCFINDVDWVIIRAVSDLAGGQEGVNEENLYDIDASLVGARLLFALLEEMNQ